MSETEKPIDYLEEHLKRAQKEKDGEKLKSLKPLLDEPSNLDSSKFTKDILSREGDLLEFPEKIKEEK
ncbi:MAG: hypothetical protein ABIH87_02720 [bacterium]